ncbi:hypothetical protein CCD83_10200 [Neisseria meningitidis]|nr:hypothetical protein CCD83_10200 [Neisseria meningitidis]
MPSFPRKWESSSFGFACFKFRVTSTSSFPRRRESSLVGAETYRENGFFRFYVLDSYFRGKDEF